MLGRTLQAEDLVDLNLRSGDGRQQQHRRNDEPAQPCGHETPPIVHTTSHRLGYSMSKIRDKRDSGIGVPLPFFSECGVGDTATLRT
jgi:hypothetical protein